MHTRHTTICVLTSGGIESAALLARMLRSGRSVMPVYVRGGLRWETAELTWLRRLLRALRGPRLQPLEVLEVPLRALYGTHWSVTGTRVPGASSADRAVYLPGRNVLLISHAAIACVPRRISQIAVGTLGGNPFSDATPRFFAQLAACLRVALQAPLRILTPLRHLTKPRVIRSASEVPWHLTFSCLNPRGLAHCGRCNKCAERRLALRAAGVPEPPTRV